METQNAEQGKQRQPDRAMELVEELRNYVRIGERRFSRDEMNERQAAHASSGSLATVCHLYYRVGMVVGRSR